MQFYVLAYGSTLGFVKDISEGSGVMYITPEQGVRVLTTVRFS
jgi:hypothetical protein